MAVLIDTVSLKVMYDRAQELQADAQTKIEQIEAIPKDQRTLRQISRLHSLHLVLEVDNY